jgi:protein TonB
MRGKMPHYLSSHMAAFVGVVMIHTGIAAWAMMPEKPIAIPQQQIIQVSMVAPTVVKQEATFEPEPELKKEISEIPPKEVGMVKIEQEKKPIVKVKEKVEQKEVVNEQSQTNLTSGLQSPDALSQESAVTEPVAASYLKNPPPKYPVLARKNKQQGTVLLDIQVSVEGEPKSVKIEKSSGFDTLDEAALDAVKKWKFVPARRGSSLVEAGVIIPIEFRINS